MNYPVGDARHRPGRIQRLRNWWRRRGVSRVQARMLSRWALEGPAPRGDLLVAYSEYDEQLRRQGFNVPYNGDVDDVAGESLPEMDW